MSDAVDLNLREQIERIDRSHYEGLRFVAEQRKLMAEAEKLSAEQLKLQAEQLKLQRERFLAPWVALTAIVGGSLGLATFAAHLLGH